MWLRYCYANDGGFMDNGSAEKAKGTRHRSPNYPAIGLREAVDRVRTLYTADKRAGAPLEAAVRHLGFSGPHGGAMVVISALKKYGLVEESNKRIMPTQRAIAILVFPDGDPRKRAALKEAALGPSIYRELFERYKENGHLPSDASLSAELEAEAGFNPNAIPDFIKDFKGTTLYAGLTDESGLILTESGNGAPDSVEPTVSAMESDASKIDAKPDPPSPAPMIGSRHDVFSLAEGPVTIQWPAALSAESYEDLSAWLDILKRKIGRSVKKDEQESA